MNISLGMRIHDLRIEKNISQATLAKMIGASQKAVDFWEKDINEPKASFIVNLANVFGVTTDYLLGLEE